MPKRLLVAAVLSALFAGCSCAPTPSDDAGVDGSVEEPDAGQADAGADAGLADAGTDAGEDAGEPDAGPGDGGCVYGFTTSAQWATGRPLFLELADLDENGSLDLVAATTAGLELRINDGQGGFAVQSRMLGVTPQTLAVSDLDGDGHQDLLVIDITGGFTAFLGNGDGTFASSSLDAGQPFYVPLETALGDLDGDGRTDFVTLDVGANTPALKTLRGTWDGGAPRVPNGSHRLVLADVTSDGLVDALVGNAQYGLALHRGQGDGGFGAPSVFLTSTAVNSVALADVTGDGVPDAVCATGYFDLNAGFNLGGGVVVLRGTGTDAGFTAPAQEPTGRDIFGALLLADMNVDGALDVVATRFGTGGGLEVLAGNDAGVFTQVVRVPSPSGWSVAAGALNGDTWPDVVVGTGAGSNGEVRVLLGRCQ